MTDKIKPWMLHDVSDRAREEAWKVAQEEEIKLGVAVNKMLLEYGNLKKSSERKDTGLDPLASPINKPWWNFWG